MGLHTEWKAGEDALNNLSTPRRDLETQIPKVETKQDTPESQALEKLLASLSSVVKKRDTLIAEMTETSNKSGAEIKTLLINSQQTKKTNEEVCVEAMAKMNEIKS